MSDIDDTSDFAEALKARLAGLDGLSDGEESTHLFEISLLGI
jgi:hypothetical protein